VTASSSRPAATPLPAPYPLSPLRPGETIGVFAPASPLHLPMLEAGIEMIENYGFRVRRAPDLDARHHYLAGTDAQRAAAFNTLVQDPDVRLLWAARGGYGTARILDRLDLPALGGRAVVGSSDLTALSLCLRRRGFPFIYGAMVASSAPLQRAGLGLLLALLTGRTARGTVLGGAPLRQIHGAPVQELRGRLEGGCLSLLAAAAGTRERLDARGAICILEDTNESPYRIDRMLLQLRRSGCLRGARAFIFGEMPGCQQHPEQGYHLDAVLRDALGDLDLPIFVDLPTGHVARAAHHPLPFGAHARLVEDRLLLDEAIVTAA
jgi:muramoyltetrapeptide carboxypeptidase